MTLAEIEKTAVLDALKANGWFQQKAAKALGISTRALEKRIRKYRDEGTYIPTGRHCLAMESVEMFRVKPNESSDGSVAGSPT